MKLEMNDGYFILAVFLGAVLLAFAFWAGASLFMAIPTIAPGPRPSLSSASPAPRSSVPLYWADTDTCAGSHLNLPAAPRHPSFARHETGLTAGRPERPIGLLVSQSALRAALPVLFWSRR